MQYLKTFAISLTTLALSTATWGEIYETTDAEGNPEFTNSRPASNATVIDVQQTNSVEATQPEQGPQPQEQQADTIAENQQPEKSNKPVIIDNPNDNRVYDQALVKQRDFERMNPEAPHQVMNTDAPHQVGDFTDESPAEVEDPPREAEEVYDPAKHRSIHHIR